VALIIDLKPNEKILIGSAVITNGDQRARLHIAGDAAIMREKDVMKEEEADTPCRKIYFLVQCMYLAANPKPYHEPYFALINEIQKAAPTTSVFFMKINDMIIDAKYYKALKEARDLVKYEEELLSDVGQQHNHGA
jgi:flagellar protein FlbT